MKKTETFLGVDLSLTSPAVCLFSGNTFSITDCKFFFLTDKKKFETALPNITGELFPLYTTEQERYHNISSWILEIAVKNSVECVFIEDYSYGSTGRVFNIAENCGILKYRLWSAGISINTIPPTVIKKHATGKGSANKELLQEHFIRKTGLDIKAMLGMTLKQWNPSSDIIDSYFICECGYETWAKETNTKESNLKKSLD